MFAGCVLRLLSFCLIVIAATATASTAGGRSAPDWAGRSAPDSLRQHSTHCRNTAAQRPDRDTCGGYELIKSTRIEYTSNIMCKVIIDNLPSTITTNAFSVINLFAAANLTNINCKED
eukprot:scaffold91_cov164-Skeletonema_marinoi.AAC.1